MRKALSTLGVLLLVGFVYLATTGQVANPVIFLGEAMVGFPANAIPFVNGNVIGGSSNVTWDGTTLNLSTNKAVFVNASGLFGGIDPSHTALAAYKVFSLSSDPVQGGIGLFNYLHLASASGTGVAGQNASLELQVDTESDSRSYNTVYGAELIDDYNGSGTVAEWDDIYINFGNAGTGTVTLSRGIAIDDVGLSFGANHINTRADLDITATNLSGGGTVDTQYGIRIGDKTQATTNYAIQTGLGKVDFGESIGNVTVSGVPLVTTTASQTLTNKTFTTPTIASFVNATHNHQTAAGGGTLAEAALALTDVTTNNVSATAHGFAPKFPNNTTTFLRGDGTYAVPPSGTGTVTSIATTSPISGGTITTTGTIALLVNIDFLFTHAQTITPGAAGQGGLTITGATETTSNPAINITQTWNASGVTFTGSLLNITNTASAVGSLLQDLQLGGTSRWNVGLGSWTATSGTNIAATLAPSFAPTSTSTMVAQGLKIAPTINYSAGTPGAGNYEALKIAATETALPTGTNYLIRASAGSGGTTDKFLVGNTGLVESTYSNPIVFSVSVSGQNKVGFGRNGTVGGLSLHGGGSASPADNNPTVNISGSSGSAPTIKMDSGTTLGWASSNVTQNIDTGVVRDAANTFAHRNGTNAQIVSIYNTFTSSTSFERLMLDWQTTANVAMLYTQKGSGGGTARVLQLNYGGTTTSAISIPITSGDITLGGNVFPTGYKSADGTVGATVTTCTGFKNGLCISGT